MFFHRKKSKSGQVLQLLESYRNKEGKPSHKVVVSLGDAGIPEKSRGAIAKYVESKLYGYPELFDPTPVEQLWIDRIVKRIDREGRWTPASGDKTLLGSRDCAQDKETGTEIVDGVLINEVGHTHETTLGPELVALKAWEALEMDAFLQGRGFSGPQRRAAVCSVINRLVDPVSENRLGLWLQSSSLPDILGEDCLHTGHDKYYKVSDLLYENQEKIEAYLSERIATHFAFQRTFILYDLTNTHFEGECQGNDKAKHGRNKQKRNDCRQVVAGVCFDEHGFVLFHKTFAGNMSDSKSLLEMVLQMQACVEKSSFFSSQIRPMVIVDAGIATQENTKLLRVKGFSYLVNETRQRRTKYEKYFNEKKRFTSVSKNGKDLDVKVRELDICDGEIKDEIQDAALAGTIESDTNHTVQASSPDAQQANANHAQSAVNDTPDSLNERLVLCTSKPRSAKEQSMFSNTEEKFLKALEKLSLRIEKGKLKNPAKIERAIGAILARHTRASKFHTVTYEAPKKKTDSKNNEKTGDQKKQTISNVGVLIHERKDQTAQVDAVPDPLLGCYVLRTDRCDMSAQELWHLYMTLTKAEDGFRSLKSDCGLRPNFHQLEHRVDAHIFISILAYQLQRFILYKLEQEEDHRSWSTLRRVLQTHTYSTMIIPTNTGVIYRIRKPGIPEECHRHIYKLLDVKLTKLPQTKIVIKKKSSTL